MRARIDCFTPGFCRTTRRPSVHTNRIIIRLEAVPPALHRAGHRLRCRRWNCAAVPGRLPMNSSGVSLPSPFLSATSTRRARLRFHPHQSRRRDWRPVRRRWLAPADDDHSCPVPRGPWAPGAELVSWALMMAVDAPSASTVSMIFIFVFILFSLSRLWLCRVHLRGHFTRRNLKLREDGKIRARLFFQATANPLTKLCPTWDKVLYHRNPIR